MYSYNQIALAVACAITDCTRTRKSTDYFPNRIVIYLPYTFPYVFEYWLIPNCTRIIAWGMVHNCTRISSMARWLIHNDRVVGKVFQSW